MEKINVYAIEASDKCTPKVRKAAVAVSDDQEATAQRCMGMSKEQLVARICEQAGLELTRIGKPESITVSLCCGDTNESVEMRDADEVRCPLSFGSLTGCPPLLCCLYSCDVFSTSCYAILAAAETVLSEERPP